MTMKKILAIIFFVFIVATQSVLAFPPIGQSRSVPSLNVTGDVTVGGTATLSGTANRVTGTNGYIDFNDDVTEEGISVYPYLSSTAVRDFRGMAKATEAVLQAHSPALTLYHALGFENGRPTALEYDRAGNRSFTYKNVALNEVDVKASDIWKINSSASLDEHICEGTTIGTCADSDNYTFIDTGVGSGFMAWGWFEVVNGTEIQGLMSKHLHTIGNREWRLYLESDEKLTATLQDAGGSCTRTSANAISEGWHWFFMANDGNANASEYESIIIAIDGQRLSGTSLAAYIACPDYTGMTNGTGPFRIGRLEGAANFNTKGDIGPTFIVKLTGYSVDFVATPTALDELIGYLYNAEVTYMGEQ